MRPGPTAAVLFMLGPALCARTLRAQHAPLHGGAPAVSPDGRLVAFTANRGGRYDVWAIAPDGSGERRVTDTPEAERDVGWLATGEIVFSVLEDDTSRIYAVRPDGAGRRTLGSVPGREVRVSPDGRRVVFAAGRFPALRLAVAVLEGGAARDLTDGSHAAFHAAWSPDGRRLAFSERLGPDTTALAIVDADGGEVRLLGAIPAAEGSVEMPAWSPDGGRIAVQVGRYFKDSAGRWAGIAQLWVVEVATGDARRLSGHDSRFADETPAWFPDGQELAFQSDRSDTMEVWLVHPDGSGRRQLTGRPPVAATPGFSSPDVSPDGRRIVFTSDRGGADRIWIANPDGSDAHAVPGAGRGRARWSRDGRRLLISGGEPADSGRVRAIAPEGGASRIVAVVPGRMPVLSPDGRHAAFLVGPWTSTILAVADADGSHVRRIAGGNTTAWNPAWSPDGRRIAYTYGDSTHQLQVHVVNADGTADRAVTSLTADDGAPQLPAWSRDGRRLVVQVSDVRAHAGTIWIVDLASEAARPLNPHRELYVDEIPAWFPDGRRVAFQSDRTGAMQIWVMNDDGSEQREVTP